MRTFTLKGLFVTAVFMLLGCLAIHAADNDLITRQITVKLDEAGTMPDKIADIEKYKITNLKIIGEINGTDLRLIREMAGRDFQGNKTEGNLATLDLSEAKIVSGGEYYYLYDGNSEEFYTSNDIIGKYAFRDCSSLFDVAIPSGVTSIGESAFAGCYNLSNITIPSGVTSIGANTFRLCTGLSNITLPSSITSIGINAFYRCSNLSNITIPSGVASIGASAFAGCSSLSNITLPSSITSIGKDAFRDCSSLPNITLPSSITSIGGFAFWNCSGLVSVYVSWKSPLSVYASTFRSVNTEKCILYVPKGTYDDYKVSNWGVFENIVEYDATGINHVTTSGDAKEISRYGVNGQRLDAPIKGLNIVKYSDGSVKKIVVQ